MKYIKTYEDLYPDLRLELVKFLNKNITGDFRVVQNYSERKEKKGEAMALTSTDVRKNVSYRQNMYVFSVRILPVNDKKLRDKSIKTKIKDRKSVV